MRVSPLLVFTLLSQGAFAQQQVQFNPALANAQPQQVQQQAPQGQPQFAQAGSQMAPAYQQPQSQGSSGQVNQLPPLPPVGSFKGAMDQFLPLSPDEIRKAHKRLNQTKKAASENVGPPPKPAIVRIPVDLSPGATPPVVRVSSGSGAVVSFIDNQGMPWPIVAKNNFNSKDFDVQELMKNGHVLTVNARSEYGTGNLAVALENMPTPLTVTLLAGQAKASDYRADLIIPMPGPNAKPLPVPVDTRPEYLATLSDVLDGIPPSNAAAAKIEGATQPIQAWSVNGMLLLRSRITILSPKPIGREMSADGTYAYALRWTPVILASEEGVTRTLTVTTSAPFSK